MNFIDELLYYGLFLLQHPTQLLDLLFGLDV